MDNSGNPRTVAGMDSGTTHVVAGDFLWKYYDSLKYLHRRVYKFYRNSSRLAWPGPDGVLTPVTTLSGIRAKINSSDYARCDVEIKTVDAQESLEGGFIVAVTGLLTRTDTVRKSFNQTFVLVKQRNGVFILSDILRVCNLCRSKTSSAANDDDKSNQAAPSVRNSVPCNISVGPASNTDTVVQNGNAEETLDISVSKDTDAEVVSPAYSSVSSDTVGSDDASSSDSSDTIVDSDTEVVDCHFTESKESSSTSQVVALSRDKTSEASSSSSRVAPKPPVAHDDKSHTWPPQVVVDTFVEEYYRRLKICPEGSLGFYEGSSLLSWPEPNNDRMIPVTTLRAIETKIMSSDYKWCDVEIETVDALDSLNGGLILAVTGFLIRKDTFRKSFSQTFFLARQAGGYVVMNDILRLDMLVPKIDAEVVSSASSSVSSDTVRSVLASAPNFEEKVQKLTYASVLAKSAATKTAKVPPNAGSQVVAPSTNNASVPRGGFASKASPSSSTVAPNGSSNAESRGVHIGRLPSDITIRGVKEVVTQFGPIKSLASIHLVGQKTDNCYGFVDFESVDAARRAVKAHRVKFGEKVMMVQEGLQTENSRGREDTGCDIGQSKGPRRSRPSTEESGWRSK